VADRLGLNLTDHKCLNFLLDAGVPITAGQLASLTGLTTGAVTGIVDRLEGAGFVRRKRDPDDRRRVTLELNAKKVRREVFPLFGDLARRMNALAQSYSERDLTTITRFLEHGLEISRDCKAKLTRSGKAPSPGRRIQARPA